MARMPPISMDQTGRADPLVLSEPLMNENAMSSGPAMYRRRVTGSMIQPLITRASRSFVGAFWPNPSVSWADMIRTSVCRRAAPCRQGPVLRAAVIQK